MREIDRKLIKAIENQRPLEEIKRIIDEGANINMIVEIKEEDVLIPEKINSFNIPLIEMLLKELNSEINEYQEMKHDLIIFNEYLKEKPLLLDIIINTGEDTKNQLEKIVYLIKVINLIIKSKNFNIFVKDLIFKLIDFQYSELLIPIVEYLISEGAEINNKKILLKVIQNNYPVRIIKSLIEEIDINEFEFDNSPFVFIFGFDRQDIMQLLKENNIEIYKNRIEENIKSFLKLFIIKYYNNRNWFEFEFEFGLTGFSFRKLIENALIFGLKFESFVDEKIFAYLIKEESEMMKQLIYNYIRNQKFNKIRVNRNLILNPNTKIANKKQILTIAIEQGEYEISKLLIKAGANVNIMLSNGMSLLEFAKMIENEELVNLIKSSPTYKPLDHNPKELVKILTNFRKDSPIKYTTHDWDFDFRKEYGDFNNYMKNVKKQWDEIEKELKELSPNIHKKTELFLFAKDEKDVWSSAEGDKLATGWSNLEGLREWCDNGKSPFDFKLPKIYEVEGKTVSKFADVINIFKREIQIRNENDHLKSIFSNYRNILYKKAKFKIKMEKLQGKNFYTDVETFKKVLDMIFFEEILKREKYPNIIVEAKNDNEKFFDLCITQVDSFSYLSPKEMFNKSDGGDFAKIKKALKNLCDWSIENKDEKGKSYRVNYLISTYKERTEYLDEEIKGFTYILRFYK